MLLNSLIRNSTREANAALINDIVTTLVFVSLGTTLSATFLIGYKIHTASDNVWRTKARYNRIVTTIVESSAVYSLVLLLSGVAFVIPAFYAVESPLWDVTYYINATLNIVSVCNTHTSFGIQH